ncbi:MAG: BON domain-containing protein [Xanthobacteraceae bacterium]|nr:BON domain-containing protein [Xanthobacteraceae bacterium]
MDDKELRQHVIDELDFEPSIDATHIGVTVDDGVVTLTGHVSNYLERYAVECAARRVKGVRGIAQDLEVRGPRELRTSDDEIAKRALAVLEWDAAIPREAVMVTVQKGWVTLSGTVDWHYQRRAAEDAVRKLRGVTSVTNQIAIRPQVSAADIKARIEDALKRHALVEANAVKVTVRDDKVSLEGVVDSWSEREAIAQAAWSVAGVTAVDDRLAVGPARPK